MLNIRSRYSPSVRVSLDTGSETRTEQYHKADCDIHTILNRYVKTGVLPINDRVPHYGDFSNVKSFQEAQTLIARTNSYFESLPAKLRERFQNRADVFLDFVNDPANRKECEELGLLKPFESERGSTKGAPKASESATPNPEVKDKVETPSKDVSEG